MNVGRKKKLIEIATEAINIELADLNNLSKYLTDDFADAVDAILESKGRLVVTGIGKSAIIAQKIVATLNSTGTPSLFMHAADAIHGDLGMMTKDDTVLMLSNSGNTPEIKVLAPIIKRKGNIIIAITGNIESTLGKIADYVFISKITKEACPNNLAPTTSTTSQLLLGDALAVTLLKCRNFSESDFSQFHPGGNLGKKLYLRLEDIATENNKPQVTLKSSIKDVILSITKNLLGATAVINEDEEIEGIITDGDIRRMLETYDNISNLSAKDILTLNPKVAQKNELAVNNIQIFRKHKISQLIVLDDKKYFGMIHIHDLNKEGLL